MNQTKHLFGTDGVRGQVGVAPITPSSFADLGYTTGSLMREFGLSSAAIARDTRESGPMLVAALESGLMAAGMDVVDLGVLSTPALAWYARRYKMLGAMVSASHNPFQDNGLKFFTHEGFKISESMEKIIEERWREVPMTPFKRVGNRRSDLSSAEKYLKDCLRIVSPNLSGLRVAIDCAHGALSNLAFEALEQAGAEVCAMASAPDGRNINEGCGSTAPSALQDWLKRSGAEVGIAWDGDGDRVILMDSTGRLYDGDDILYLLTREALERKAMHGGVVGTVMSNYGLEHALRNIHIPFVRSAVGDRWVSERLIALGWNLGGETSGHVIQGGWLPTGDGLFTALTCLHAIQMKDRSLAQWCEGFEKVPQVLINIPIRDMRCDLDRDAEFSSRIKYFEQLLGTEGRLLLRRSGTEPVLRIMAEGRDLVAVQKLVEDTACYIRDYLDAPQSA